MGLYEGSLASEPFILRFSASAAQSIESVGHIAGLD